MDQHNRDDRTRRKLPVYVVSATSDHGAFAPEAQAFPDHFVSTRLEDAIQWARKYSFFPYPFVTACC